jgi:epsQ protein
MKFAGVVVWYNPDSKSKENINSYLKYLDRLYIVDNSNYKNEVPKSEKIMYIPNMDNLGIAEALNIGARRAIVEGYNWLLTMDQDSSFSENDLLELEKYIENKTIENIGIVSPWHKTKMHKEKPKEDVDYPLDVMTSGNLVNLDILKKIGEFKSEYFIDGVDMEYCLRLNKNGYKIARLNYIELNHNLGDIFYKKVFNKEMLCLNHNYLRVYYKVRNYRYIKKEYGNIYPEFCNKIVKTKALIWCIIFYEKDKFRKLRSIIYAKKDFKKGIMGKYNH